jgi:hypothetical protein
MDKTTGKAAKMTIVAKRRVVADTPTISPEPTLPETRPAKPSAKTGVDPILPRAEREILRMRHIGPCAYNRETDKLNRSHIDMDDWRL